MNNPRVLVGSLAFHLGGEAGQNILNDAADKGDILLFTEGKYVGERGGLAWNWSVVHYMRDDGTQGNFFAIHPRAGHVLKRKLHPGIDTPGTHRRDILEVLVMLSDYEKAMTFLVVHPPPKRLWKYWPAFMRRLVSILREIDGPIIVGGDFNKLMRAVMAALVAVKRRKQFRFKHIMGAVIIGQVGVGKAVAVQTGRSDHKAVRFTITRIGPKKRAR